MGNLVKYTTPRVPPAPGTPATGGSSPHEAYCIDTVTLEPQYIPGGFYWILDSNGNVIGFGTYAGSVKLVRVVDHDCFPASPGSPAVPGTPGSPGKPPNYHAGWNGAATSIRQLPDSHNGQYRFQISGSSVGVVTGFNTVNEGEGYAEIDFAIYARSGMFTVMESGVEMNGPIPVPFAPGDVFVIDRSDGVINYSISHDGGFTLETFYTSGVKCYDLLFVDASLYMGGDEIDWPDLLDEGPGAGRSPMYLPGLVGFASVDGGPDVHAALPTLTGVAISESWPTETQGFLSGLVGEAYDDSEHSFTSGILRGLVGAASGDSLIPPYAIADGVLQPILGFGVGFDSAVNAGLVHGVLGRLYNYASDYDYHEVVGLLGALELQGALKMIHGTFVDYGALHRYPFLGVGHSGSTVGLRVSLSGYRFRAFGGGTANITLPSPTFIGSGTTTIMGRLQGTVPRVKFTYALNASGTRFTIGKLDATYRGKYALNAHSGGGLTGTLTTRYSSAAAGGGAGIGGGTVAGLGRLVATAPRMSLYAHGKVENFGSAIGELPGISVAPAGVLVVTGARYTLRGIGHVEVTVEYEGYSITLTPTPEGNEAAWTTHYTTFPFDRIVRFGNKHYGVATDGLYLLGGDTFDGEPIVATFQMAMQDHSKPEFKRGVSVYLTGRVSADMDVSIVTDEKDTNVYQYRPVITGAGTARVMIGKGIRAHYWAYRFSNTAGQDFTLDNVTPLIAVTKRNV